MRAEVANSGVMDQPRVDLHADAGEGYGPWSMGDDAALAKAVSSLNVACGFHAGDPAHMTATVRLCRDNQCALGAHPGYDDRRGFGRRPMPLTSPDELVADIRYQIGALRAIAAPEGVPVSYVKLHGALDNQASVDPTIASVAIDAVGGLDPNLVLYAQSGSVLAERARSAGLMVCPTVFADRAYRADGTLVPRSEPGAVIHDPGQLAERAIQFATEGTVDTATGQLSLAVGSICVHGDTPGAVAGARTIRAALADHSIQVGPPRRPT